MDASREKSSLLFLVAESVKTFRKETVSMCARLCMCGFVGRWVGGCACMCVHAAPLPIPSQNFGR